MMTQYAKVVIVNPLRQAGIGPLFQKNIQKERAVPEVFIKKILYALIIFFKVMA